MNIKVLEVKNITKIYKMYKNNFDRLKEVFTKKKHHKEFIVNDDISFELYEGETLGIIGVNGAGKSTILKIIAGVISSTSGSVIKKGRITALLELGTGFNSEMTGYDNIYLNGTLIGMQKKEINSKIQKIISFSELENYIYEPIKTYSSGMRMRLAFSIAIFSEPKILIVDEALSVGDAHFSAKCTQALNQRRQKKMSIIYVSHDLNSLKLLCDRLLLFNKGRVEKEGSPNEVINYYNYLISKFNDKDNQIDLKKDNSFGTFDVEMTKVTIEGEKSHSNIISSGENAKVTIEIKSKIDMDDMTIGIMIKDRFGQDLFGTSTYHHNLDISFEVDKEYVCTYEMPLNLGAGKYSISMAIHSGDSHLEHCLHWLDYAADFEIVGFQGNMFVGKCRLEPNIKFKMR